MAADPGRRRRWMSVLALAPVEALETHWRGVTPAPAYRVLRGPETGLVMVRARAGGGGMRFNLGEMTLTRCTVQLEDGALGHAWVGGRRERHAELAAVFDALLQGEDGALEASLIAPLAESQAARRRETTARAAASRVEFFTMVRGDD